MHYVTIKNQNVILVDFRASETQPKAPHRAFKKRRDTPVETIKRRAEENAHVLSHFDLNG